MKSFPDRGDFLGLVDHLAAGEALESDMVCSAGPVQSIGSFAAGGLDHHDLIEAGFGDEEIDERSKEVPRTEL